MDVRLKTSVSRSSRHIYFPTSILYKHKRDASSGSRLQSPNVLSLTS